MAENFPRVSILIPTYNRAAYLEEAIATSLNQDYPNFEVIVSDNASTDETQERIKKHLKDPRLRYYRHEKNLGSGPNYRKLLYQYATGEYGHYLTDDDYFVDPEHLKKAVQLVGKYQTRTVFSGALSRYRDERNGRSLSLGLEEIVPREWWLKNLGRTRRGLTYFPSCGSGTLFQIDLAKQLGAFQGEPYGDFEFAVKCILADPHTGYLQKPQYVERRHEGQDGRTSYSNAFQGMLIFHRIYEFGLGMNLDPQAMDELRLRGLCYFMRGFLLHNWVREKGSSLASFLEFLGESRKLDPRLPRAALRDPNAMAQFFFYGTWVYRILKMAYFQYRSWFTGNDRSSY